LFILLWIQTNPVRKGNDGVLELNELLEVFIL